MASCHERVASHTVPPGSIVKLSCGHIAACRGLFVSIRVNGMDGEKWCDLQLGVLEVPATNSCPS